MNRRPPTIEHKVANQLECQQKCKAEPECVVISYIQETTYSGKCHVCSDRYYHYRRNGWNLHKKPRTPG